MAFACFIVLTCFVGDTIFESFILSSFMSSISLPPHVSLLRSVRVSIPHSLLSVFHNTSCKASRFNAPCSITEGPASLLLIQQTLQTNISRAVPQRPISAHIQKRTHNTCTHLQTDKASKSIAQYHWKTQSSISTCGETCRFILKSSIRDWRFIRPPSVQLWTPPLELFTQIHTDRSQTWDFFLDRHTDAI